MEAAIRTAQSSARDVGDAVRELQVGLAQPDTALVIFFCAGDYDLDRLAGAMRAAFPGVEVVGCTSAGEIGPAGYLEHSLVGVSFPAGSCSAVVGRFEALQRFDPEHGLSKVDGLLQRQGVADPEARADNSFALLLIDGLSMREEPVARVVQRGLGNIPLVGGSAADGLRFARTRVYYDGAFHDDSAVLVVISTRFPFLPFKTQHVEATDTRMVVTRADASRRIVYEINGRRAADEYARLIGKAVADLDTVQFAETPLAVLIDGKEYVRSIRQVNPDGSLTLYCAIDQGVVLRVAHSTSLLHNLERLFADVDEVIGPPQVVLACDCILRNIELERTGLKAQAGAIYSRNRTVGFSTYGEQFGRAHVNQTLTGIAIGRGEAA